jgi:hypothetical protein
MRTLNLKKPFPFLLLGAPLLATAPLLVAACGDGSPLIEQSRPSGSVGNASGGTASGGTGGAGQGGAGQGGEGGGAGPAPDDDGDGIADSQEQMLAEAYLPFISVDPADKCSLGGIVYRVRPHPMNPALIHIIYDHLFENDCGAFGHVGDNEVFGATIDPSVPPPAGILALRAVTHQGQLPCEKTTECGSCSGLPACSTTTKNGEDGWPVAFSSKDKHATYVEKGECGGICLDSCTLAPMEADTPLVNAGEPDKHLTEDLTANGFITAANGWKEQELFNFNPWDPAKSFGGAGNIADDLQDDAFLSSSCQ